MEVQLQESHWVHSEIAGSYLFMWPGMKSVTSTGEKTQSYFWGLIVWLCHPFSESSQCLWAADKWHLSYMSGYGHPAVKYDMDLL